MIVCCWSLVTKSIAQSSPEPSSSPDERIQQRVEERIQKVLSTTEQKQKRALVGTLKSISNSTLTIETQAGDFQAEVATDAAVINLERKTIEVGNLEIGSKIISMGYFNNQSVLETKRIVIRKQLQIPTSEAAFGSVSDISQEEKVLTIKHPKKQTVYMVEVGPNTKITKRVAGKIQTIKFSDIEENDHLVAIGEPGENKEKIITAKLIHVTADTSLETPEKEEEQPSSLPEASPVQEEEE